MTKVCLRYSDRCSVRCHRRGFTLLEIMLAVGLTAMVYTIISYMIIQMNTTVRRSEEAFQRRKAVIDVAEQLRWQLRCLYNRVPEGVSAEPPSSNTNPASLQNSSLYAKNLGQSGRDVLIFKTTYFPAKLGNSSGTAEVGYKILSEAEGSFSVSSPLTAREDRLQALSPTNLVDSSSSKTRYFLAYRQYPWADPLGLHEESDDSTAPWQKVSSEITGLGVRFSDDLEIWQQDWTGEGVPRWVEITFELKQGDPIVFMTGPVVSSARW
ncbi:MAG: type II secretion system protein J [Candidatus Bruticola sp.]